MVIPVDLVAILKNTDSESYYNQNTLLQLYRRYKKIQRPGELINCLLFSRSVMSNSLLLHELYITHQAFLSSTICQSLFKLIFTVSVMSSNHLILCHPLPLLPSIFPSIRIFSNESVLHIRWPKYLSFSFSISSSNEYSGQISIRMDWVDLLAVQRTLSPNQH